MPIRSWEVDQARLRDPARLRAVHGTGLVDAPPAPAFDRFTREASSLLDAPISLVTLVDADRQFFAAQHGRTEPRETPLSQSLCKYAVSTGEPVVIDAVLDHKPRDWTPGQVGVLTAMAAQVVDQLERRTLS